MNLSYHLFKKVTNNFSEDRIIGRGGFGNVYKGVLDNGELIAVKLIHSVQGIDDRLFKNEVCNLFEVDHPNIVGLLGYCDEIHSEYIEHKGEKVPRKKIYRVLCFEYFSEGSLDKHIDEKLFAPNWSTRYNIIKGICEGLNFLHGRDKSIFHLDLKPGNILLDSFMLPKLADFGLSRLFRESNTQVTQQPIGTNKYMPPEYRIGGKISDKNDVFSFGVVMIEIMEGTKGYSLFQERDDVTQFKQEVITKWGSMIEPTSESRLEKLLQVETCIDIAVRCVDSPREKRPTIANILDTLNKTETGIPKTQLPVVSLSPTKNSLAETLKKMTAELDNKVNSVATLEQVPDRRDESSDVKKPLIISNTVDRVTTSFVEEELIIGRTEEKQKILSILSQGSTDEMIILPIWGIGGIGKTTLAQLVFNDRQFQGYSRVWVYVSEKLDFNKIGNSIIAQLTNKESKIVDMELLRNNLAELLASKSILIVLDDLWEKDKNELDNLKAKLRLGKANKVIIVTTRDKGIARNICCTVMPYKLEILTDDMCWSIIKQKSHFEDRDDKRYLEQIGREIAIKCGGVALAARSLGYMLRDMTSGQWESVRVSHIWNSSSSENPSLTTHDVLASLWLSYLHMHKFLQFCFSYCGVFPKGHNIMKYDLIHQWTALELVEPSTLFDAMQLCENYITQLLGMSFLQYSNAPMDYLRRKEVDTYFTMHDLVHDLARATLADKVNKNENVAGSSCQYALLTDPSMPLESSLNSPENLKALHFLNCRRIKFSEGAISPAKCLLVLDLRGCGILELPDSIGQLKQLRYLYVQCSMIPDCVTKLSKLNYLSLRNSEIKALPDSIGDIKGLLHLDLYKCGSIRELPVSFAELKQLMHLNLSFCDLEQDNVLPEVISKLPKLRYLVISGCNRSDIQSLLVAVSTLHNLEHLDMSESMKIVHIPECFGNLKKLQTLDLSHCSSITELPSWMNKMVSLKTVIMTTYVLKMSKLDCSSNLVLFGAIYPCLLQISELENVMSLEEAQSIELIVKALRYLKLEWTLDCNTKHVDDKDVLEKLVARKNIVQLHVTGYRSLSFPTNWQMGIEQYLPNVYEIFLDNLPKCSNLPPLGQLPNLTHLHLHRMDSLEELNTADSCGELLFPELVSLHISSCPGLRVKPCLPRSVFRLSIKASDNMLISLAESVRQTSACPISLLSELDVGKCTVPLHQWEFLQHVSVLGKLTITDCSNLASFSSPEVIQRLSSLKSFKLEDSVLAELPTWLGQLTFLPHLTLKLPKLEKLNDNIRQLTRLQSLYLFGCRSMTSLPQWFGELTSLQSLTIGGDGITSLPTSMRQLTELSCLTFGECYVLRDDDLTTMLSSIPADKDEINIRDCIRQYIDNLRDEDYREFTYSEEDIEEHEEGIEEHQEVDVNNNATRADAHGHPGVNTAAVADEDAAALVRSPSAALYIESSLAAKNLSDPPADAVNTWTHENLAHRPRAAVRHTWTRRPKFEATGRAGAVLVEATGRTKNSPLQLLPAASAATGKSPAAPPSLDTTSGSRINNSGTSADAIAVGDANAVALVPSLSALSIESGSATKILSVPLFDVGSHSTQNMVRKSRVGVSHTRNRQPRQLVPGASSSGPRINNSAPHALIQTGEVHGKTFVSSFADSSANADNTSTHENVAHKYDVGVEHTSTPDILQLVRAASATTTDSPDTSGGSRINNSAADALIPTDVVATPVATDMEDLVRRFSALSLESSSAAENS